MKKKLSIEDEINLFLETWDLSKMKGFFEKLIPLIELYEVDEEDDWIEKEVKDGNHHDIRLIQTVYLMSKIVEEFSGPFCKLKIDHPKLWQRMERQSVLKN